MPKRPARFLSFSIDSILDKNTDQSKTKLHKLCTEPETSYQSSHSNQADKTHTFQKLFIDTSDEKEIHVPNRKNTNSLHLKNSFNLSENNQQLLVFADNKTKPEVQELKLTPQFEISDTTASNSLDEEKQNSETSKPSSSYIALIGMAIASSKTQKLLLYQIYDYITHHFAYYRNRSDNSWRNSVRHNLSFNEFFVKSGRSSDGKGYYWSIHPANLEDFKQGNFSRRYAINKIRQFMVQKGQEMNAQTTANQQLHQPLPIKTQFNDHSIPDYFTNVPSNNNLGQFIPRQPQPVNTANRDNVVIPWSCFNMQSYDLRTNQFQQFQVFQPHQFN